MREPLLTQHPQARAVAMRDLVGIAQAISHQAVLRSAQLAQLMERRGAHDTAEAFRRIEAEERRSVEAVAEWAAGLHEVVPSPEQFEAQLPPEMAASWDEAAASALLTPYRAYALAVRNEERAFTLYIYLSAYAKDEMVKAKAERLAAETQRRAAHLRRWRRRAYRQDRDSPYAAPPAIGTVADLQDFLSRRKAAIVGCLYGLAGRLREVGDEDSAALLQSLIKNRDQGAMTADRGESCKPLASDPVHLLFSAEQPLERLSDELERILETSQGESAEVAEQALSEVVSDLARLAAQINRKLNRE